MADDVNLSTKQYCNSNNFIQREIVVEYKSEILDDY